MTIADEGGRHCEPSGPSEPGLEHNLVGASAIGYVSKLSYSTQLLFKITF